MWGGEEVISHCGGQRVIFFMDDVMYFLSPVVKELWTWLLAALTVYCFQRLLNMQRHAARILLHMDLISL